jgi:hypothetical protein
MRIAYLFSFCALVLAGCEAVTVADDVGDDGVDPVDNGLEEVPVDDTDELATGDDDGVISGLVQVEIYGYDSRGEVQTLSWEETYGENFPFGSIFVAAYTMDEESGRITYLDEYVIRSPDIEGNRYELKVGAVPGEEVRVYAILDYLGDGILSSNEPIGVWPDVVPVTAGEETPDVDIDILAAYTDFTGGGGGGGGGVWDSSNYVWISGDGLITVPYAGGSCLAMIYDTAGLGPYYADSFTPVQTEGGAEGAYGMWVPKNMGNVLLRGAWDANYNGLIDPADQWGQYVDESGAVVGAFQVADVDLPDHTLMIPDGTDVNPSIVPFVVLGGNVSIEGGFDALDPGAILHVAAMKYRPDTQIAVSDIPGNSYDYETFSGADLTGSEIPFTLIAPANTLIYFWAYLDADGDGAVNEVGEQVGSFGGEASGRIATGTESRTDMSVPLHIVEE